MHSPISSLSSLPHINRGPVATRRIIRTTLLISCCRYSRISHSDILDVAWLPLFDYSSRRFVHLSLPSSLILSVLCSASFLGTLGFSFMWSPHFFLLLAYPQYLMFLRGISIRLSIP